MRRVATEQNTLAEGLWRGVWDWDRQRLKELVGLVGPKRLVLDLSCRKQDGVYKVNAAVHSPPTCLDTRRTLYARTESLR
jgi:hypothetical protein